MNSRTVIISGGHHPRECCPVSLAPVPGFEAGTLESASLLNGAQGKVPLQSDGERLWFVLPRLRKAETIECFLSEEKRLAGDSVEVEETAEGLRFRVGDRFVTTYRFSTEQVRPFFHPLIGPEELSMTRSWPMSEEVGGEDHDHKHHRSFWVAHGDVNGTDHWGEAGEGPQKCGRQIHLDFDSIEVGPVFGRFVENLRWDSPEGEKIMGEKRRFRLWNTPPELRIMDLTVEFIATEGDVLFGDTKEGGICSLRVAEDMKGDRSGRIVNALGAAGEEECWGKRSSWVDYAGTLRGKDVGIAVLDHPLNPLYPTFWHVRDYGLFSANPFGLSYYQSSFEENGDWTLAAGSTAKFRYRIILHAGDGEGSPIRDRWLDWVHPPQAEWKD